MARRVSYLLLLARRPIGLAHWACGQWVPVPASGLEFPGLWISCCAPERNGRSGRGKGLGWRRGLPIMGSLPGAPQGCGASPKVTWSWGA